MKERLILLLDKLLENVYLYDKGGRLLSIKDSHGRNDSYTYNSLGLPVTVQTKEGRVNYYYQKGGALMQVRRVE